MNDILINFNKTEWSTLEKMTSEYHAELHELTDGFHNGMMFAGEPFEVVINGEKCGFISLIDCWEGGKMITSYYIKPSERANSPAVLTKICDDLDITAALVASGDAHFVSVAFEKMKQLGTTFEMQAFNHTYGEPKRPAEFGMDTLREVKSDEFEMMNKLTEKQWDGCYGDEKFRFYAIFADGVTLGYGAIGELTGRPGTVDIGNFTLPQHRRKGVGRSMLINLGKIAVSEGKNVVAGCWYHNKESIPTLASSGFVPSNRIFFIKFKSNN